MVPRRRRAPGRLPISADGPQQSHTEGEALAQQVSTRSARRDEPLMREDEMFLNKPLSLLSVRPSEFRFVEGDPSHFGSSGKGSRSFCPYCGTR